MKIIIINASHRHGNSDIISKLCQKFFKNNAIDFEALKLREIEMNLPDGCEFCAQSENCPNVFDQFEKMILPRLKHFNTYIIITPTWSNGPTPLLNIFINRIVSSCHPDKMWLKNKKVGVITHGMADESSWELVIDWIKSICSFNRAIFAGSYTFHSDAIPNSVEIDNTKLENYLKSLIS